VARPKLKIAVSWGVVGLGLLIGFAALSVIGTDLLPSAGGSEIWYLRWMSWAGPGLLAFGSFAGSLVAPRNPKRAAVIFLTFLPVTAFCMAYPDAGIIVWDKSGNGWFESPLPLTAIGLSLTFFAPFAALLLLPHDRKRGAMICAAFAIFAIVVFALSRWTSVLLPRLASDSVPFVLFGVFWLGSYRFRWPILLRPGFRSFGKRIATAAILCFLFLDAGFAITVFREGYYSSLFNGDCRARPPFVHAQQEDRAVFTARVIYVGRSVHTRKDLRSAAIALRDSPVGDWAIGVIQERFWGIPSRWPHLVLLTNFIFWKGGTYFIDGGLEHSLLSSILPAVEGGIGCSRSRPIQEAIVDLHLLRKAPPRGAVLVGSVREPGPYAGMMNPFEMPKFLAGAQIEVTGPSGTTSVTTDASGVYELDGLAAGDYTVRLRVPEGERAGGFHVDGSFDDQSMRTVHLKSDVVGECNFVLVKR
jgi:hypothetical protein